MVEERVVACWVVFDALSLDIVHEFPETLADGEDLDLVPLLQVPQ